MKNNLKKYASDVLLLALQKGISDKGEKSAMYFAGNISLLREHFEIYIHEINKIDLNALVKTSIADYDSQPPALIKAIQREIKLQLKQLNNSYNQTLSVLRKNEKQFNGLHEETKEKIFQHLDSIENEKA